MHIYVYTYIHTAKLLCGCSIHMSRLPRGIHTYIRAYIRTYIHTRSQTPLWVQHTHVETPQRDFAGGKAILTTSLLGDVSLFICTSVCMHACMNVCMCLRRQSYFDNIFVGGCEFVHLYECMYACMNVCMCLSREHYLD